jgi:hypothetical protein
VEVELHKLVRGFQLILVLSFTVCVRASSGDTLCLIQINDIYEISPLQNGRVGGIARIATFIDECERRYDTKVLVAGDFISPSVMGTDSVGSELLSGK